MMSWRTDSLAFIAKKYSVDQISTVVLKLAKYL